MSNNKLCGIYIIENKVNHKKYIGQSLDVNHRKTVHFSYLKNNTHQNIHLQSAFNKYGKDNFNFNIILQCEPHLLNEKERYYIEFYKTTDRKYGYNKTCGGEVYSLSETARRERIEYWNNHSGQPIYQIDLSGKIINEWTSARKAARDLEISQSCIYNCLKKKRKTYKNFIWIYKNDIKSFNHLDFINSHGQHNPVLQLCLDTEKVLREFVSIAEASRELSIDPSSISKCCLGKMQYYKGYKWRYKNNQNKCITQRTWKNPKRVAQLNVDGVFLKEWDSAFQASKELEISYYRLLNCLNGKKDRVDTYRFVYIEQY